MKGFHRTKYIDGILPIDTYKKDVDSITNALSIMIGILYGQILKSMDSGTARCPHRCLQESSSVVSNATNGIEAPRDYLSVKKSKKGPLKQIV